ncbi:MAG: hypothetical protein LQ338_000421 [Usnochroma carphineum]|nr:MAG: hypothetical protein LQ338_000421 [Usnochroma carphineum]
MCCGADILLALLAVLFPPLPVWIKTGLCSLDSLINLLLCMLGFVPGLLHAWYIIAKVHASSQILTSHGFCVEANIKSNEQYPDPSASEYEDLESAQGGQHVTYYYVSDNRNSNSQGDSVGPQQQRQQYPGYGTVQGMRVPPQPQPQQSKSQPQAQGQGEQVGEGSSQGQLPPSYEQAIAGDNKVQT